MHRLTTHALAGLFLLVAQAGCQGGEGEPLSCINDDDCPATCTCVSSEIQLGRCQFDPDTFCGGSCTRETDCPQGASCAVERTESISEGDLLVFSCQAPSGTGGNGGAGGEGGSGGTGGATGCASLGGDRLLMRLDWSQSGGGELDVGATTPNGTTNVVSANYNGPDADLNCTHSGDEPTQSGMLVEDMRCIPPMVGNYTIQVDNSKTEETAFDLLVTIDGGDVPGFPQTGNVGGNSSTTIEFCIE